MDVSTSRLGMLCRQGSAVLGTPLRRARGKRQGSLRLRRTILRAGTASCALAGRRKGCTYSRDLASVAVAGVERTRSGQRWDIHLTAVNGEGNSKELVAVSLLRTPLLPDVHARTFAGHLTVILGLPAQRPARYPLPAGESPGSCVVCSAGGHSRPRGRDGTFAKALRRSSTTGAQKRAPAASSALHVFHSTATATPMPACA